MRRIFICDMCGETVQVVGDLEEIRQLILDHPMWTKPGGGGWPCFVDECGGEFELVTDQDVIDRLPHLLEKGFVRGHKLNPQEFFRALCGDGLPDELAGCEPEVVASILSSSALKGFGIAAGPSGKTILSNLVMSNGLTLHLCSSPHGPMVYKITRSNDGRADQVSHDRGMLHQASGDNELQGVRAGSGGDDPPRGLQGSGGGVAEGDHLRRLQHGRHRLHDERVPPDVEEREGDGGAPQRRGSDGVQEPEGSGAG